MRLISALPALLFLMILASADATEKPNVILIMCDDLGWGDLKAFNPQSPIATPHLDEMAQAGLKFNRFYAAAPVCSPTRGSCLTGRHPFRYGIYFANTGHLPQEEITLPEILKQAGYRTGHFGKWHLGTLTTEIKDANRGGPQGKKHFSPPSLHGYDRSFVTESKVPTYDPMIKPKGAGKNSWDYLKDKQTAISYGTKYWDEQGEYVSENLDGDDSRVIMDRVLPFIKDSAESEEQFFAAVWFHSPHLPVVAGPEHVAPYNEFSQYERNYYGCITAMDEQIGRLRAELRKLNIQKSTMIWFCSDNGPEGKAGKAPGSAGPYRGRKRSLYEGGVRVPALLEWPEYVQAGTETDFPTVTSDYLPTILDVLDLDYPAERPIDGVSLLPLLQNQQSERTSPIGFQSAKMQTWVTQRHKLVTPDQGKSWELFDLLSDQSESIDLAEQMPEKVEQLRTELQQWLKSCQRSDEGKDY